jgi:hypothetical protein
LGNCFTANIYRVEKKSKQRFGKRMSHKTKKEKIERSIEKTTKSTMTRAREPHALLKKERKTERRGSGE